MDINIYKKRLHYISCHRGTKENDLIFLNFCKKFLNEMNMKDLQIFEELLNFSDSEIFDFVNNKAPIPVNLVGIFQKIQAANNIHE